MVWFILCITLKVHILPKKVDSDYQLISQLLYFRIRSTFILFSITLLNFNIKWSPVFTVGICIRDLELFSLWIKIRTQHEFNISLIYWIASSSEITYLAVPEILINIVWFSILLSRWTKYYSDEPIHHFHVGNISGIPYIAISILSEIEYSKLLDLTNVFSFHFNHWH